MRVARISLLVLGAERTRTPFPALTTVAAPAASPLQKIVPEEGGFVNMLVLDMDAYAEKYGEKAVRKNLTIPAWLNTFAEKNHINFSQVLQDALTALYQKRQNAS